MKKKAFTLIELIAVLVILAILALIVTPLVMNIIRKARVSADKRSIDAYGRSVELAIANYLLDNGDFPTSIDQLTIEYLGDEVVGYEFYLNEMLNRIEEFKTHPLNDYAQIQYVLGLENIYTKFSNINTMLNSEKISSMLDNIKEILQ